MREADVDSYMLVSRNKSYINKAAASAVLVGV